MIYDKIENFSKYCNIDSKFVTADFLVKEIVNEKFIVGRKNSDNEKVYANRFILNTKPVEECVAEVHKRYIDIHIDVSGEEDVLIQQVNDESSKSGYNANEDYQLYNVSERAQKIKMGKGYFLLLFPGEVHTVGVSSDKTHQTLEKSVVKIEIN